MQKEKRLSSKILKKQKERLEREMNDWNSSSPSRVIFKWISINVLTIVSWIVIAFFVYIWWQSMGSPVGCERISTDLCNYCFGQPQFIGGMMG